MSTTHQSWKIHLLGGLAVAGLLSATACGPADKDDAAGSTPAPATPSATASADPGSPGATPSKTATAKPTTPTVPTPARPGGSGGAGDGQGATAACTDANISLATTYYRQDSTKHVLLTATNTGDKPCTLYLYPSVRFGGADPIGPLESDWHAVATIAPKGKAYAGVRLYRVGQRLDVVTSMTVGFRDRENVDTGKPLDVSLADQGGGLNIEAAAGVTYWNTDVKVVEKYLLAT
ncbi:DUF4232 domain-containing protein [Streptomyces sp. NPDC101733]|uniref:DUF4232 domain-containing protein n=1 Tax=unclassified Streptomyces TaxID=2593676 RepID=UPI0037F2D158